MLIYVDKSIFSCKKKDLGTLVGRISSISLDLSSNFFTTNKACKEILIEEQIQYKCYHFSAQMSRLRIFCRENVANIIYALWWAGLAQKRLGPGALHCTMCSLYSFFSI